MFRDTDIDERLARAVVGDATQSPAPKRKRPVTTRRVGSGKGSPLKPRKIHVSKRQQRVRAKRGFDMSQFGGEGPKVQCYERMINICSSVDIYSKNVKMYIFFMWF